jgi:hypothetical protein
MNQPTGKKTQKSGRPLGEVEDSHNDYEKLRRVEMINFSRGGMCFESGSAVGAGARIIIKRISPPLEQSPSEALRGCLAEVRWCKPLPAKDAPVHRVGVEYVEPVDRNMCFEWRADDKICIIAPRAMDS